MFYIARDIRTRPFFPSLYNQRHNPLWCHVRLTCTQEFTILQDNKYPVKSAFGYVKLLLSLKSLCESMVLSTCNITTLVSTRIMSVSDSVRVLSVCTLAFHASTHKKPCMILHIHSCYILYTIVGTHPDCYMATLSESAHWRTKAISNNPHKRMYYKRYVVFVEI